jgi:hypothetical protein
LSHSPAAAASPTRSWSTNWLTPSSAVGSLAYINQASLGADFLTALYDLAPPDALARFVTDVAGQTLSGQAVLERIRAIEGINRGNLERLITTYFGQARPPASSGVPAATPEPANR